MDIAYPTIDEPATPEYVLAVLQDCRRLHGYTDPNETLTFETPVGDWIEFDYQSDWKRYGRAMNKMWGLHCKNSDWKPLLKLGSDKCMFDVCEFIANRTTRPRIREARLLGRPCLPGGAFLTIRSLLAKAGANAEEIGPSTELALFTRRHYRELIDWMIRLSPGELPRIRFRAPLVINTLMTGFLVGLILMVLSIPLTVFAPDHGPFLLFGGPASVVCVVIACAISPWMLPASVEIGNLRTFRDLAIAMTSKKDSIPEL